MKRSSKGSGLSPLSFMRYFCNNKRKSLAMICALMLSVFMILVFQMVTFAVNEPARLGDVGKVDNMTQVHPGSASTIDAGVLAQIKNDPMVERMVPMEQQDMDYYHFFGTCNISIFFISDSEMKYVLDRKGLKIKEGRLPKPGRNEMLLDWRSVNNRNKKLGDYIGKEVDPREKMPGKYKIVGITEGNCLMGLIPVEAAQASKAKAYLIFPKDGKVDALNAELSQIPKEKAHFWTKQMAEDNYTQNAKSLNIIFGVLSVAIILVMAFAAGNASYAQYFSRRYEFGLLQSIGYTKAEILLRAAKEILLMNLLGYIGGLLLGLGIGLVLNQVFFIPRGYPFTLFQPDGILKAVTIPVCTAVFGLIPAAWLLGKIDPMTVIEKFE